MDASIRDQMRDRTIAIAGRIRAARRLRGWTQVELAAALGVTFQQVQKYEKGANRVSVATLVAIAEALALDISFFLPAGAAPVGRAELVMLADAFAVDAAAATAAIDALAALRDRLVAGETRLRAAARDPATREFAS